MDGEVLLVHRSKLKKRPSSHAEGLVSQDNKHTHTQSTSTIQQHGSISPLYSQQCRVTIGGEEWGTEERTEAGPEEEEI
jgi:hypothetical protein